MKNIKLDSINKIPASTWSWLKINRASLETAVNSELTDCLKITESTSGIKIYRGTDSSCSETAVLEKSLPPMETPSTKTVTDFLNSDLKFTTAIITEEKAPQKIVMEFNQKDNQNYSGREIIIAEEGTDLTLIMIFSSMPYDSTFCATQTKIWAKKGAKVHLVKVQLFGQKSIHLDDSVFFAEDESSIKMTQIELGGEKTFTGVTSFLSGESSAFLLNTAYIAQKNQILDINQNVIMNGKNTNTAIKVNGVLKDQAIKTYRGTIDFQRGCAGAKGDEQEETLLLSPQSINKSIPVILCDEEDVEGTHGSTCGKLGSDELFYFQSRGITENDAEKIMTKAKILGTASEIPSLQIQEKIASFIE